MNGNAAARDDDAQAAPAAADREIVQPENARMPRDADGYTVSFDPADEQGIAAFFAQHGVVVVRGVLGPDRVEATVDEIFSCREINAKTGAAVKSRTDPADWEDARWPTAAFMHKRGFISPYADFELRESWMNRQDPRVVGVFRTVLGRDDLHVNLDRYGVMRPTVMPDGSVREDFLTRSRWLHWDQNPWQRPDFYGVQGLIALSDSHDARGAGGFACVPGLHADGRFGEWAAAHPERRGGVIEIPEDDPLYAEAERVNMRPGSLLVWDSRVLHCNVPNRCAEFRLVQYVTYFPAGSPAMPDEKVRDRLLLFEDDQRLPAVEAVSSSLGRAVAFTIDAKAPPPVKYKFPPYLSELGLQVLGAIPYGAAQ